MDGAVVVPAPSGFAIAAKKDSDEPALTTTTHDLSETTRQNAPPKFGTPLAHWRRRRYCAINYLGEELGEG